MTVSTDAGVTGDATGMSAKVTDGSSANACGSSADMGLVLWGDGTTEWLAHLGNTTHLYTVKGTYTIRYAFKDDQGNKAMEDPATITLPDVATAICAISGTVTDGTNGINNATIYLKNGLTIVKIGKTDSTGNYSIANVQAGISYTVVAQKNGYTFSPVAEPASCGLDEANNNLT